MSRRSRAGGKPTKPQRRKRSTPSRCNAPKALRDSRSVSTAGQETVARLTHERDEALLRETANSEILRLILRSPGDLELVFRMILEHATRICDAKFGTLFRFNDNKFHLAARVNTPSALAEFQKQRGPFRPPPGGNLDRMVQTKQVIHTADDAANPVPAAGARLGGARSIVHVPMLKEDGLVGALVIYRQEVRPFTDKQIALLQNFAAHAVIAIENARLLNELRQRTADLAESLEQQTATADVLSVIRGSPGELEPVFQTILQNGTRLCEAKFGMLYLYHDGALHSAASHNVPPAFAKSWRRGPWYPSEKNIPAGQAIRTKQTMHITDLAATPGYRERVSSMVAAVELGGVRTVVLVPMLKEDELVGIIAIYRQEVRPFTDKQIELVKNFAAQGVIAIENARLLNELRQRTTELTESLEQQTATSEVLGVISSSPGELEPVFQTILDKAVRICDANFGVLPLVEGGLVRTVAMYNLPHAYAQKAAARSGPGFRPHPLSTMGRLLSTKRFAQVFDYREEPAYKERDPVVVDSVELGGARTLVSVPMLKENKLIGAIQIFRQEVRPFTDKQIALVQNFAAQAVIAIENAQLLRELNREREALARQHQADARYISWLRQLAGFLRHEVRQPVAQINSSVELIHLTSHDDQLKPYIASASQGVRHVWNLIERASRATDAEAFVRQGQAQTVDLPRLIRELIGSYQQTHSGIEFRLQLPDKEPLYVSADPTLLKEAVSNLLANAASFADEESIIQVVLERDGVHAVIKVRNKGPIIQYDTEMLFGPFASTRSGPSSEHQGLGLYLVRLVAECHGGKAIISNLDDGSGVEASIFLPL